MYAVKERKFEVIALLLREYKVDCEIKDKMGYKARDLLPDYHGKRKWMIGLESAK